MLLRVGEKMVPTFRAQALRVTQGALNHVLLSTSAGALIALFGGTWHAFVMPQLLFDVVNPAGAMLLASVLASGVHYVVSERKRPWARQAFSRYVSSSRVAHLMARTEQPRQWYSPTTASAHRTAC